MGFFNRQSREASPFWRTSPPTNDPTALHQHGISCISNGDGPGAVATGWALWSLRGLDQFQAWDFLTDGYRSWRTSASFDPEVGAALLTDILNRLGDPPPAPWPDLYAVPREMVDPVATVHSAICWTWSELLEIVNDDVDAWQRRAFDGIRSARKDFVPPRSMSFANTYAASHDLPAPWE